MQTIRGYKIKIYRPTSCIRCGKPFEIPIHQIINPLKQEFQKVYIDCPWCEKTWMLHLITSFVTGDRVEREAD